MLPIDNDIREQIIEQNGNIAISASAGTGKTHITVKKIIADIAINHTFRTFAAITFTKKAAKEIEMRLLSSKGDGFVGTNDNFVLKEIINPFMYDVYGREFKKEIKPDYSSENVFGNFESGINKIKDTGFICKYSNNRKNFSFQLALKILEGSEAARRYMQAKYFRIFIDEYQDSDIDMHNLFIYICKELKIPVFIVGDLKQSIYGWRGGYAEGFYNILKDDNFHVFRLRHNFRSSVSIQNYSNMFMDDVRQDFQIKVFDKGVRCFAYKNELYSIAEIKEWVDLSKPCAFLVRANVNGERWAKQLNEEQLDFKYIPGSPLDRADLESEHIWIARQVALYIINELYSEYDFYDEIPNSDAYIFYNIRKQLEVIQRRSNNDEEFSVSCIELYELLGYIQNEQMKEEISILYNVVNDAKYYATYNSENYDRVITTIHAAKGLEYKQVIVLAEDYNMNNEDDSFLHYVAVTRPEQRLLILYNYQTYNGKIYWRKVKESLQKLNEIGFEVKLEDIVECKCSEEFSAIKRE